MIAWNLALNYIKTQPKQGLTNIPPAFLKFTQDQLTSLGITYQDLLSGVENVCTVNAKIYTDKYLNSGSPIWPSWKQALVDEDTTLTQDDKASDFHIARLLAWLKVTAEIGQEPRHYAALMKITNDIRDVCNMSESDFMQLTGLSAIRNNLNRFEPAKDFNGNNVGTTCGLAYN